MWYVSQLSEAATHIKPLILECFDEVIVNFFIPFSLWVDREKLWVGDGSDGRHLATVSQPEWVVVTTGKLWPQHPHVPQ